MSETPSDPARESVALFEGGESDLAELRGFTLTGGRGTSNAEPGETPEASGGGILFRNGSSPTVTLCTISGNAARLGGGVYCGTSSSPVLRRCTVSENTGGGVWCLTESSPVIEECSITGNRRIPGSRVVYPGIHCGGSVSSEVRDCEISRNAMGGIWCVVGASPTIVRSAILENTGGGVWCMFDAAAILELDRAAGRQDGASRAVPSFQARRSS